MAWQQLKVVVIVSVNPKGLSHLVNKIEVVYQCEFDAAVRTPGTPKHQFFNSSPQLAKSKVCLKWSFGTVSEEVV